MIKKHWPELIAILAAAIFLAKAGLFFYQNPQFTRFWDWPGHIEKAASTALPGKGGWNTVFWGGYPTTIYPGGFHLVLKLAIKALKSETAGAIAAAMAVLGLQLFGLWRLSAAKLKSKSRQTAIFLTGVIISVHSSSQLLGSFQSLLTTGAGPAGLATAILLLMMAAQTWPGRALFWGLLLLTHPLTASVAAVFLILQLAFAKEFLGLIVGLVIGLPWILPYIDPAFATSAINIGGNREVAGFLAAGILIFAGVVFKWKPVLATALLAVLISMMPQRFSSWLQLTGIHGIHFYRYLWYGLILAPAAIAEVFPSGIILKGYSLKDRPGKIAAAILGLGLIVVGNQPKNEAVIDFDFSQIQNFSGRVMDASRHATAFAFPHAAEHELARNTKLIGTTGLFYESASRGLQYYALKNVLDPFSRKNGTKINYFTDIYGKPKLPLDIKDTARLLGVNYVSFTGVGEIPKDRENLWEIGAIKSLPGADEPVELKYVLEKIDDSLLIQTLAEIPQYDPKADLGQWWVETDRKQKYTKDEIELPPDLNLSQPQISDIDINQTQISFSVDSSAPAPVEIKFTYSPYWKAEAVGENSYTTRPLWLSPGHILVFAAGNINLNWETPSYIRTFQPVSTAVLLITLAMILLPLFLKKIETAGSG